MHSDRIIVTERGAFQIRMMRPSGSDAWLEEEFQEGHILFIRGFKQGYFMWVSRRAPKIGLKL